jgi:hypothetical protein
MRPDLRMQMEPDMLFTKLMGILWAPEGSAETPTLPNEPRQSCLYQCKPMVSPQQARQSRYLTVTTTTAHSSKPLLSFEHPTASMQSFSAPIAIQHQTTTSHGLQLHQSWVLIRNQGHYLSLVLMVFPHQAAPASQQTAPTWCSMLISTEVARCTQPRSRVLEPTFDPVAENFRYCLMCSVLSTQSSSLDGH